MSNKQGRFTAGLGHMRDSLRTNARSGPAFYFSHGKAATHVGGAMCMGAGAVSSLCCTGHDYPVCVVHMGERTNDRNL